MAEFGEVLRQFDRMCKANAGCYNCPLHKPDSVSDECSIGAFVNNYERIEREVMKWAAEHPEPVYPTWQDFLEKYGLGEFVTGTARLVWLRETRIPADIAEKLGIQPKEG